MEKELIEVLILLLDKQKEIQARDDLLDLYIKRWPREFDQCSFFEMLENDEGVIH